jgi:5'-phosphate synthase pdxT subunit
MRIGVLALQGDFAKHLAVLAKLGVEGVEVRQPADLDGCSGLIIPGGESTTLFRAIEGVHLKEKILAFSKTKPLFGTCAGLILMSKKILHGDQIPWGILDVEVERNAFGRQAESFRTTIEWTPDPKHRKKNVPALFIRAPRIRACGPEVEVLATYGEEPILIRQGRHLGATFHPELTDETAIHALFLGSC